MNHALIDFYRCPKIYANLYLSGKLRNEIGYFQLGPDTICYGQVTSCIPGKNLRKRLCDISNELLIKKNSCFLPFNLSELIDNLRYERYINSTSKRISFKLLLKNIYYSFRPIFPVKLRKHLQKIFLFGWDKISFPNWPIDLTVERILDKIIVLLIKSNGIDKIPFIWFWPEGQQGCLMMTHDIETSSGRDFCSHLIALDTSFGIKSSFEVIPEARYEVSEDFLESLRANGCEVCIHGLNHDGYLFSKRSEFERRVKKINEYAKRYRAIGFRSPVMYRNLEWFNLFEFSYDMSVPNVGHLDPQRGGCCTIMPYFIGDILELPLTTIQDYSLFNILNIYSISLWQKQIEKILEKNGLISFIIHPDYIISKKFYYIYKALLEYLSKICVDNNIWIALPKEIDSWWRQRSKMELVRKDGNWHIEGPGKERARLAYAMLDRDKIVYEI